MKCLQCGYQNKPDADACNLCGTLLKNKKKASPTSATVEMRMPGPGEERPRSPSTRLAVPAASGAAPSRFRLEAVGSPPVPLVPGPEVTIGRQPGCSFQIPSTRVSRLHAVIRWEGEQPILVDKGSSNGTFVRGKRIKEHPLQDGDEIEIGPFLCVYRCTDAPAPAKADDEEGSGDRTQTIAAGADLFTGSIGEGGLMEILGGLEFNKKTGTLDVFGKEGDGWLSLKLGVPLAAKANGKEDEEAVFSLLAMKTGRYAFSPEIESQDRRIKATVTALLLEFGRRADESSLRATQED